jgi:erythritol transport system ATP-binding protein
LSRPAVTDVVLEARRVVKDYGGTRALDRVDFDLHRGEVSALIGENGAGKSTLVRILGGIESPTSGTLLIDGAPIMFRSIRDAESRGIGVIHQELNLCPNLSVSDNIFLARESTRARRLDRRAQRARTIELLNRLEHPIDPDAIVGDLPLGQQQIVEIARALARDVRVLMMDEPTSALSSDEIGMLFRIIRELSERGVAIVYISHRLGELLEVADRVSVLRDGRMVAQAPAADIDTSWIVEKMTGRAAAVLAEAAPVSAAAHEILRIEDMSIRDDRGRQLVRNVSLNVAAGEVLGIYGLLGAGVTALLEGIVGARGLAGGRVLLERDAIDGLDTAERIRLGLAFVPEDRQGAGLVPSQSVRNNICLSAIRRFVKGAWVSDAAERAATEQTVRTLGIRAPHADVSVQALSGGNQQKVVFGRALLTSPKLLLLDEPTRGVDVGAKADIHALVRRLAREGMAVMLGSSDVHDIRATADRIVVLSRGSIAGVFLRNEATDDVLARAAGSRWRQELAS